MSDKETYTDPLKAVYHDTFADPREHMRHLLKGDTALLCIDLQYLDAAEGFGVFEAPDRSGVPEAGRRYYFDTLADPVLPNVHRLQQQFRDAALEVIHTRIQALTRDGRDRSAGHKRLGLLAAPGSREADFLEQVAPVGDEIVINKTASGVFSSTNLNYVLTNLGVRALFVCGVYTNECVETTVRDACDLGYSVSLVEDACTTVTPELQRASLATLRDRYARIITTAQAITEIRAR